ncbi:M48 family metalloprotease [Actinoallomurus sp. NPDC052274]|uniref:M48 family metalloprotease n=1 Tax=Actinoallomurus sp. NPDC052274 TaxID=3155420 RepID=UPI0034159111
MVTGGPPAGWYPDPGGRPYERFWDGRTWTTGIRAVPGMPASASPWPGPAPPPGAPGRAAAAPAARPAVPGRAVVPSPGSRALVRPPGSARSMGAGPGSIIVAVAMLIPAAIGALAIAAPIAYGLHLVWPVWGAVAPFAAWVLGAAVATWPGETIQRAWCGYRDPTAEEHRRLTEPSRAALRRMGLTAGRYRLMIAESDGPNAPAVTGRTVVITSYAVTRLPSGPLEAVLAHELGHHRGPHAVPVLCHTVLTLPIRALWWLLARIWHPVRRMWAFAKRWHTPFGFLVSAVFTLAVALIVVASAIPAGVAFVGATLARLSTDRAEFLADAAVVDAGLGPQLLAALETAIEAGHLGTDRIARLLSVQPLVIRRAQRLRRHLAT